MRWLALAGGAATLALAWTGAATRMVEQPFSAHMSVHMAVVAVAAPLLAIAVAGGPWDPVQSRGWLFPPIPASIVEFIVVWSFHTPAMHHWVRHTAAGLFCEQALFFTGGLYLWMAALGGAPGQRDERAGSGVLALLLTSMHMTLLGALIALAPRPLFAHQGGSVLADQQLGGAIMLLVGGVSYLVGGLALSARLVRANNDRSASKKLREAAPIK